MKKLMLVVALFASAGCQVALSTQAPTPQVSYTDTGIEEAVVCSSKRDAMAYVKFAGDNDTEGFEKFTKSKLTAQTCHFLGNSDEITVLDHQVVLTGNGPLYVIQFRQGNNFWWSSANYFPESYPRTAIWEDELLGGEPLAGQVMEGSDE